jgi:hypothetical protein
MPKHRPRANRLRKIKLTEVSLVRRGANPLAHVVLTKQADPSRDPALDAPLLFNDALSLLGALPSTRR